MKSFFRYAKNRFLYSLLRILVFIALGFILSNFLLVNRVYADTYYSYDTTAQLYDNNGGVLTALTTNSSSSYWYGNVGFIANSSGAAWGFSTPMPLIEGHTYSLTAYFSTSSGTKDSITFSSVNRIGVGTSLSNAVSSYQNGTGTELVYSNKDTDALQFVFNVKSSGSYLVVPFCATYSISSETVYFDIFIINDLGTSSDVSQDDINNSLSSQTNELNNSINNSTNTITGAIDETENNINSNIDDMEQNIIDSNKETQEVIKDQFNTCRDSKNLYNFKDLNTLYNHVHYDEEGYIIFNYDNTSGTSNFYQNYYTHDLDILPNKSYYIVAEIKSVSGTGQVNFTSKHANGDGQFSSHYVNFSDLQSNSVYIFKKTSNSSFSGDIGLRTYATFKPGQSGSITIRLSVLEDVVTSDTFSYEPYGEQICTNKMDETNDKLDEAEETRKGIWATIKDLPNQFLNMLKSLIIPDSFDFIYDFKESLENKLGFIASVPLQFIEYIISLPNKVFTPITSVSLPEIDVFGVKFWNAQEVDISEGLSWFSTIKICGDVLCVTLMINTLHRWYKKFGGGSE